MSQSIRGGDAGISRCLYRLCIYLQVLHICMPCIAFKGALSRAAVPLSSVRMHHSDTSDKNVLLLFII